MRVYSRRGFGVVTAGQGRTRGRRGDGAAGEPAATEVRGPNQFLDDNEF